jgi:hypothetical protein
MLIVETVVGWLSEYARCVVGPLMIGVDPAGHAMGGVHPARTTLRDAEPRHVARSNSGPAHLVDKGGRGLDLSRRRAHGISPTHHHDG